MIWIQLTWHIWVSRWSTKGETLFGTNDSNKEGDKRWATVGSPDKKCLCIKNNNSDGKTERDPFGTSEDAKLGYCCIKMIGVTEYFKIGEEIDSKEAASMGVS